MNRKLPSILLIALLNWGLIISSAKAMDQAPLYSHNPSVTEELPTTFSSSKAYTPPRCGTPSRLEGGGTR